MIDLVDDELNATLRRELVQSLDFRVAHGGARWVVRTVDQDELRSRIREALNLLQIDVEVVLPAQAVETRLDAQ